MAYKDNILLKKKKKTLYALLVIISGFFIYVVYIELFLSSVPLEDKDEFLLITQINILLISIVTLFVIRYVIKIIYERKRKLLGSKMKTRLMLAFLILFTAPTLLFFYITNDYISNKFGKWLVPQTNITIDKTISILQDIKIIQQQATLDVAPYLANEFALTEDVKSLGSVFQDVAIEDPINGVAVYDQSGQLLFQRNISEFSAAEWQPLPEKYFENFKNEGQREVKFTDGDNITHVIVKFSNLEPKVYFLEAYLNEDNLNTAATVKTLDDLTLLRSALGAGQSLALNHKVLLAWISLMMLFIFTWFAFYLSRSIVRPLDILLKGMHRVTNGDLKVRLPTEVGPSDELKEALQTFNEMVLQINKKSHEVVEKQNQLYLVNHNLDQKNQILQNTFKSIKIGSATITSEGYLLEANQAFLSLFQLDNFDFQESPKMYKELLPVQVVNVINNLSNQLAAQADVTFCQKSVRLPNLGEEAYYKFEIYRIYDDKRKEVCRLILLHDLTELDQLIRARTWQDVARRIAHEIKNPLTPIRIGAERLKNNFLNADTPNQKLIDIADSIISDTDEIKRMINEFSNFARMPLTQLKPVLVNRFMADFTKQYLHNLPDNIELKVEIPEDEIQVMLDEHKIKQALYNLLQNALNSLSQKGGIIKISLYKDAVDPYLHIKVSDNGPGIPKKMQHSIFEPYVRILPHGAGLGLAIVKKIVNDHGGKIILDSQPFKQTIFTISLPLPSN